MGLDLSQIGKCTGFPECRGGCGQCAGRRRPIRFSPTGDFQSVQEIGDVLFSSTDQRLIRLKDFATITRAYEEVPAKIYYLNGKPGLSIGISMAAGQQRGGCRPERHGTARRTPAGHRHRHALESVYDQPLEVENSVGGFLISVGQAVAIVLVVLLVFMGVRTGIVIGAVLLITVAGTLFLMNMFGIELQRISLGALVIALGMLVDNAIVVAEGMLVRMESGMRRRSSHERPLVKRYGRCLVAQSIGILAFSAIGLSPDNTGEFASSLFYVILISLALSWITAISTTPLLCALLLKQGTGGGDRGSLRRQYVSALPWHRVAGPIDHRWLTIVAVVGMFVASGDRFWLVKSGFFPRLQYADFLCRCMGARGHRYSYHPRRYPEVSQFLREQPGVVQTTSVIGGPHQRFTLVYDPGSRLELRPDYRPHREAGTDSGMIGATRDIMQQEMPWTDPIIKPLRIGPGRDAKIEARFSGPDPEVLRQLSEQAEAIMRADPDATDVRNDWRSPVKYCDTGIQRTGRPAAGVDRQTLGEALKFAFDGYAWELPRWQPVAADPLAGARG